MPGIVGLLTGRPCERAKDDLLRMVEVLRHEAFYETGTWIDESLGVYVGWIVRKGAFAGGMPLRSERGDVILVFAGEEFPDQATSQQLRARGHQFDSDSASYLVHLYEENRSSFPQMLNGRFHGLVVDRNLGTATLFNDRYGMQRLYRHEGREAFYFAAEAKAILAVCPDLRRVDPRGLAELIVCGCVLENRTLFTHVGVLPSAAAWTFRRGSIEGRRTYFYPGEWEEQATLEPEAFYRELREVFSRNVDRYFQGHEPVAMSLTGGLDTRMIMAWHEARPGSLPCYTFGSMERDCRDVVVARRVAHECHQAHEVITVGDEFLARFPHYAERATYLTDGCVDVGRSADLYINERAREIAPVRITGNFGGEVLRGVRTFKAVRPVEGLYHADLRKHVSMAEQTCAAVGRGHPLSFAVFRQAPWHQYGVLALEQTQLALRSPYLDNDFVRTVFRAPQSASGSNDVSLRLIADGNAALRRIVTDRGVGGGSGRLTGMISRAFLEVLFKAEYVYDMGMPQWLARVDRVFSPLRWERLFLGRHKVTHYRIWYRDVLSRYVREMLLDPRALARPYLERRGLEAVVRGHLNGVQNHTATIHTLLGLELLHRLFIDSP